jgi:Uri superfamily endonuclease
MLQFSKDPGTYALVLHAHSSSTILIGRRAEMLVQPGYYIYVGSAFGPSGLRGRLRHHLAPHISPHWHIDYLRQAAALVEVWTSCDGRLQEHEWARALIASPVCALPFARFGASDCRCQAHLVHMTARPSLDWFQEALRNENIYARSVTLLNPVQPS